MSKPHSLPLLVASLAAAWTMVPGAQGDPWLARTTRTQFQPLKGPYGRIALEYPRKDWQIVSGGGSVIMTLAQRKSEAAIVIEHSRLNAALAPEEITDVFKDLEVDTIKERQPNAAAIESKLIEIDGRRLIGIQYTRPGVKGPERVRQYSFPDGQDMYRLICSAQSLQFAKYEAIFSHIAATFSLTTGS